MTLQQLRYYCMACECRNITKAAKRSFVTQPAVTAAIRELEKEYEVRLMDKDGKHIRLTKAGESFYKYASQMLDHAKKFDSQVQDLANHSKSLRIGLTKSAGSSVYMEYFLNEAEFYRDLELKLTVDSTLKLLEELREKELDIALIINHGSDPMDDLGWVELKKTEMLYCVSKIHPLAQAEQFTVSMIAGEKMVSTQHDQHKSEALKKLFLQHGCEDDPQVVWRFDQLSTALKMVAANLATGYFPADGICQYEGIVGRPVEGDAPIPICTVWGKDGWRREEVQRFVNGIARFYRAAR